VLSEARTPRKAPRPWRYGGGLYLFKEAFETALSANRKLK
jgi:hypothetical protein